MTINKLVPGESTPSDVFDSVNGLNDNFNSLLSVPKVKFSLKGGANSTSEAISDTAGIHTIQGTYNPLNNPYAYIYGMVDVDRSIFQTKVYRVYYEVSEPTSLMIRVTNGHAWGSGDGSLTTLTTKRINVTSDNLTGYYDIDMTTDVINTILDDPARLGRVSMHLLMGTDITLSNVSVDIKFAMLDSAIVPIHNDNIIVGSLPYIDYKPLLSTAIQQSQDTQLELDDQQVSIAHLMATNSNAGVVHLMAASMYSQYQNALVDPNLSGLGATLTKEPSNTGANWYAIKIKITFDTLQDLNRPFHLGLTHISGQVATTFNIVKGAYSDWGTSSNAIGITNSELNLYEKIINSSYAANYEASGELYINVAHYSGTGADGISSVWHLAPYFEVPTSTVIASDMTVGLEAAINEMISGSRSYITFWGDSLTAGGGWTSKISELSGYTGYNAGTGGENSKTIMARQGADVMITNNIVIPATTTPVLIADRDVDVGIDTELGGKALPLLQGGSHVNPVQIAGVEGTLSFTGVNYADMTGDWVFTRSTAGAEVTITRPTAIRTDFDRNRNKGIQVIFIGQNGGYTDIADLVKQNRMMIEHSGSTKYVVLGLSSGSQASRADYEAAMTSEFGRNFISLREYLAAPIYDTDGVTLINCYGLDDSGLVADAADLTAISSGTVPPQMLSDSVHYTSATKTVIGNMLYKKMRDLNMFV